MYIKEVTIDGFKSYAQRVTLSNFDPGFNAITGLNGSGKSNILDAICFVLGIKNLSQVRAQSLTELVYKQGSAGVTKATVSIMFHNDDPNNGPTGFADKEFITVTRQVVIGGRDKYLINGHAAQQGRVADLFQSVQLNVNNPHFLIMQGRVTKIMNMKPAEILSLLEEASGTKLYERKKDAALKVLAKKQTKLDEIDQLMNEELLPSLRTLERQCAQYHEYAVTSQNHERLKRFCIAYEYTQCIRAMETGQQDLASLQQGLAELESSRAEVDAQLLEKGSDIKGLQTEKEIQAGGEVKELQEQADKLSLSLAKDTTNWRNKQELLDSERATLASVAAQLAELDEAGLAQGVADATAARDAAAEALAAAEHGVEAATRELAGAQAGDGRDESNKSLQERLADATNAQTAADAEAKAAEIRAKHLSKQASEQRRALGARDKEAGRLQAELAAAQAAVDKCQAALEALGHDPAAADALEAARAAASSAVRSVKERVEALSSSVGSVDFSYRDPERGWDRGRVKGVVARLVRVQRPEAATALEVAAGGKLYQVVVDNDKTAKALLERGALTKRVTIIPLNQIRYSDMPAHVVAAAQKLGGGRAAPAIELVGYQEDVAAAIKYTFGGAFVCEDSGTAKKLAFAREVSKRCITLQGDDFNPGGLLTGGSRGGSGSVLSRLTELAEVEEQLAAAKAKLAEAEAGLQTVAASGKEFKRLHQELELQQHSLLLLQEKVAGSESHQLAAALAKTEGEAAAAVQALAAAQQKKKDMVALAKSLQREIADFSKDADKRIKAAKDKLKGARAALECARKALRAAEQELQRAIAEGEAAEEERAKLLEASAAAEEGVQALEAEVRQLAQCVGSANEAYAQAAGRLEAQRQRLKECDAEIRALEKERDALTGRLRDIDADRRRAENKLGAKRGEIEASAARRAKLEEDFDWIAREKRSFGTGEFDFNIIEPHKAYAEYEDATARLAALKERGVERQAELMYRRNKEEVESLTDKRDQVERDREKITGVIGELDEKKRTALKDTWTKVDRDFGGIFSTLLPGTQARLVPPEGGTFEDGLEVKVAFGGVWKESLTELSGGQRSLLALSLILALCRFKPAPIYILDEVDAALDLNHTQNIGAMIKQHFPESQFIVVSLKEGMFNNANVIFRTKFVEGVSTVTRTVNDSSRGGRENAGKYAPSRKADAGRGSQRQALREHNA